MATWLNNDGLQLNYGIDNSVLGVQGEYRYDGPVRCIELEFSWTQLPTVAENSVIIGDTLSLPKGAQIERVEIATSTDWDSAGDAMTLNVGIIDYDRTSNADVDFIVQAATQTELITGGENISGWSGGGWQAATTGFTTPKLITWEVDTAAATAGYGAIRIYYNVLQVP